MIDPNIASSQQDGTGCLGVLIVLLVCAVVGWFYVAALIAVVGLYVFARFLIWFGQRNLPPNERWHP